MHFGVLGPLEVDVGTGGAALGRRKQRGLLAVLLTARNTTVPIDRLIDLLWDDEPPPQAMASVQAYVSNLRRLLEPDRRLRAPATRLVSRPPGYSLVVAPGELDADRFASLVEAGARARDANELAQARRLVAEGLQLWRGPAYGEFAHHSFAVAEATRLEALRHSAIEDLLDIRLAEGDHHAVAADAEVLVAEHPLRERGWELLMVALYRAGRQGDALRAFQRAREVLGEELGVDPSPRLRSLEADVLAQSPILDVPARPVAARSVTASTPPDGLVGDADRPPIVGRDLELGRLTAALDRARTGSGAVIVIDGEAGVGKSALALTLANAAAASGMSVGIGHSPETRDAPALWPWAQVLRQLGGERDAGEDAGIIGSTGMIGDDDAAPAARRTRVVRRIVDHAKAAPTLVVIDDVQWSDGPSHHVLRLLADEAASAALLVIATRRVPADDEDPALVETMAHLVRARASDRIHLRPLDADAGTRLVRDIAGPLSDELAATIHERSGGNPFYAVELARLVTAEGPAASGGVPATVRDVVRRRLARLPEQAVAVISIAAVLGTDVEPRVVAHVAGLDLDPVLDLLDLAVVVGLLTEGGTATTFRFTHDLLRTTVEATLPAARRARLHAAAVGAIEAIHGDAPSHVHALARHALAAVVVTGPQAAIDHVIASGRAAQWALDLDTAAKQYQSASELVSAQPRHDAALASRLSIIGAQTGFLIHGRTAAVEASFRSVRSHHEGRGGDRELWAALGWGSYAPLWGDFEAAAECAGWLRSLDDGRVDVQRAISAARYLEAFGAWTGSIETARPGLDASIGEPNFGVGPAIRRGLLAVLDVIAGQGDEAFGTAAIAMRDATLGGAWSGRAAEPPGTGPWVAAWTGAFAALALALVSDEGLPIRDVVQSARTTGAGIRFTDLVLAAAAHAADALDGDDGAIEQLADARAALAAGDDGLFGLPLSIVELRVRQCHRRAGTRFGSEISAEIRRTGQTGWQPVLDAVQGG
ncbi:MAG: BTAD domain-containing putative transcriptional regulator [Ilumatobacteraceae bacterium]|nr:BTAD domain-containing putative transcriptional regulator [Ilumatobacteraceae bacterium]